MKKHNTKRIFACLLALALTVPMLPAPVFAEVQIPDLPGTCPCCGAAAEAIDWSVLTPKLFQNNTISANQHVTMDKDVALSGQVEITNAHLLLDLNGHTLTNAAGGRVFNVSGGSLTIFDSSAEKTGTVVGGDVSATGAANYGGGTIRLNSGTFTLLSGTITGGTAALGGNIYVDQNSATTIAGGTVRDGYAAGKDSSSGRGGNIYTLGAVNISGDARILNGYAQVTPNLSGTNNSGRGGNIFAQATTVTLAGNAALAFGYAESRGGNLLVNNGATLFLQENAEIYGGVAKSYGNNVDVMTAHLNMSGGTIYAEPAGGGKNNINVYKAASSFTITGGKLYGRVAAVASMTIHISGDPYVQQLYLPSGALITPGALEKTAWVGLELAKEDQTFTGPLEDPGCCQNFFAYDYNGVTRYHQDTDNSLYMSAGTPCRCCGQALEEIQWTTFSAQSKLTAGHYKLTKNVTLKQTSTITVDGSQGSVTLNLNGYILTGSGSADVFTVAANSSFTIMDTSSDADGFIKGNGHRALNVKNADAVINIYGGNLTGSVTGDNSYGGTVYLSDRSVLNLYGGAITGGFAQDHGGNLFANDGSTVNLYGGAISNGLVSGGTTATGKFDGNGGNIYLSGGTTTLNIYGGLVDSGLNQCSAGGNIFLNTGASGYMYGGTVENGGAERGANIYVGGSSGGKYSQFYMFGGTITMVDMALGSYDSLSRHSAKNPLVIYNGKISAHQDLSEFVASCSCYQISSVTTTVWNYGHKDGTCDETCPMEIAWGKAYAKTFNTGSHDYAASGKDTCTCAICSKTHTVKNMVCVVGSQVYTDIHKALEENSSGVLRLLCDLTATELAVGKATLDLNGYTLTADAINATAGHIIDSTNGKGLLRCESLALNSANTQLPVKLDEGIRFSALTPDVTLERMEEDLVRIRFTFKETSDDTIIDDLVKAGNSDLSVELKLTWTKDGQAKERVYVCNPALLTKYAQKWDSRRYVITVGWEEGVSDLTCTVQLSSGVAGGTTFSGNTLKNVAIINQKLTWDAINSYPMKTKDMTVAEMRQLCVDFMTFTKTYLWTPDQTVNFKRSASGGNDSMEQGQIYGGLPYVGLGSGNVYRMMDYINPETGLVDMEKALPNLKNGGTLATADLKFFGSQCSESVYWAWGRVMNSTDYAWSYSVTPYNGFVWLGDIQIDDITNWSASYNTDVACAANGRQAMYKGYAQLQKADGLVYYVQSGTDNGAGHLVMAYSDAYVVYNSDGTIDGTNSYVLLIDQAQGWTEATNDAGDTYQHKKGVGVKHSFSKLYSSGYIPFTFKEFIGEASIEDTTVRLVKDNSDLISGTILETDRSYDPTVTTDTLSWKDLFASRITSNYGIVDVYVTLYDGSREIYRHAVRSSTAGNKNLSMAESGDMVTIWQNAPVTENKTYSGKIEVQLATGERVTIFSGSITT